jgi:7-cyano-7-deazaguanine synthase
LRPLSDRPRLNAASLLTVRILPAIPGCLGRGRAHFPRMTEIMLAEPALVLFSGGQDSTTCLAWALASFAAVETVGFDYGQRHRIELACRPRIVERLRRDFPHWRDRLGDDQVIDLTVLGQLSNTALTRDQAITLAAGGLPTTFVPGRNLLFFAFAAALAYRRGIKHLVGGMCETDYSGYPDCRDDTLKSLQATLSLGMDRRFVIHTPLMWRDKAATWALAERLGGPPLVELIGEETHSCYRGDRTRRHPWGYGCGACPACELRRRGWEAYAAAPRRPAPAPAADK